MFQIQIRFVRDVMDKEAFPYMLWPVLTSTEAMTNPVMPVEDMDMQHRGLERKTFCAAQPRLHLTSLRSEGSGAICQRWFWFAKETCQSQAAGEAWPLGLLTAK